MMNNPKEAQNGFYAQVKFPIKTYEKIVRYQTDQKFLHGRRMNVKACIIELVEKGAETLSKDS